MGLFSDRTALIDTENAFKVGPYIARLEGAGHRVVKANFGEPDFPLPRHIAEEVKRQIDNDHTHYVDPQGILPLREAVAGYMGPPRGLEITPERVVVFPGAKPPIGLCQQTYCNPGDEVIYPSPGFPIYESFIGYVGAKPVPLHLEEERGFAFTGEELGRLITERTKLIFFCFPSNPTGGVATREEMEGIAAVIREKAPPDCRIYSDEVYENILFDGAEHTSIASFPGMAERTVMVSGASKSYSWTGGRIGWAVFPTVDEAQVFKNLNINYFSCIPGYNQLGAKMAIESPLSPPEIRRMVTAFQDRRNAVVAGLNSIEGVTCQTPKGAFYVFPNIGGLCEDLGAVEAFEGLEPSVKAKTSPSTLFQMFLLFRYQVAALDRRSFGQIGAEGKHFLRISIATGIEDLEEAVDRIGRAARDREGFSAYLESGDPLY
jgi:aspartate/methionine/tyrosine aminotransferase